MVLARPDLWGSEAAAKRSLADFERSTSLIDTPNKGIGPFKIQQRARYRKGLRGRWSEALVPEADGRQALEAILGPLAAFELMPHAAPEAEAALPEQAGLDPSVMLKPARGGMLPHDGWRLGTGGWVTARAAQFGEQAPPAARLDTEAPGLRLVPAAPGAARRVRPSWLPAGALVVVVLPWQREAPR